MFSALRQGSSFFILDKTNVPKLKIGSVVSVSQPMPKYNNTYVPGHNYTETVVDVVVKVNEEELKFEKLPSNLSIANFGQSGIVVSESKEAMNGEVESMLRNSKNIIESVPYHKDVLVACDEMMKELNPQLAKEKEQEQKIAMLENRMGGMESTLQDIHKLLNSALSNKSKEL
jgi:ribosome-associated translation inhibitor RaiA